MSLINIDIFLKKSNYPLFFPEIFVAL